MVSHDRVTHRECRPELPRGHLKGIVPRHDQAHHADRFAAHERRAAREILAGCRPVQTACGACEEAQVVDRDRHFLAHDRQRLAHVCELERAKLLGVLSDRVGEGVDLLAALARGRIAPCWEGAGRRAHSQFHVGRPRVGNAR